MKIAGILFRTIGILALIGTGLLIFLMTVVGDRYCHIQIRNERDDVLIVKTVGNNPFNRNPGTDSVVLKPNEEIGIGACINCSTPKVTDILFDSVGIFEANGKLKMMDKHQLIEYLETFDKDDCVTYNVE
jgi:hypothetical protein